ncbi:MAG: GAF domain-containing protein [Asticcacaulis sp.]|nr:GAF domain-containing protein [Asticcacaulis sp.]
MGQGLVGTIAASARALNLPDAQQHPAFAYLPETGEEIYSSFLGVPVLRAGRTLGVLVVQNRTKRQYRDDEVEALETAAMVIAEMIAAGELARLTRPGLELDLRRPASFTGISFNDGVGLGHVVLHEPRIVVTNLFNEDSDEEMRRLEQALGSLRLSIDDMLSRRDVAFEGEHRAVLEAYRMFANDRGWVRRLDEAVRNGLTAEAAGREGAERHARAHAAHDRSLSARADERFRRPRQPAAAHADEAKRCRTTSPQRCPRTPSSSPARWARPSSRLPAREAARAGAGGRRRHQPRRHRGARHGHSRRPREGCRLDGGERATPIIVDGDDGHDPPAPAVRPRDPPMPRRCASAPAGRSSTASCAKRP